MTHNVKRDKLINKNKIKNDRLKNRAMFAFLSIYSAVRLSDFKKSANSRNLLEWVNHNTLNEIMQPSWPRSRKKGDHFP